MYCIIIIILVLIIILFGLFLYKFHGKSNKFRGGFAQVYSNTGTTINLAQNELSYFRLQFISPEVLKNFNKKIKDIPGSLIYSIWNNMDELKNPLDEIKLFKNHNKDIQIYKALKNLPYDRKLKWKFDKHVKIQGNKFYSPANKTFYDLNMFNAIRFLDGDLYLDDILMQILGMKNYKKIEKMLCMYHYLGLNGNLKPISGISQGDTTKFTYKRIKDEIEITDEYEYKNYPKYNPIDNKEYRKWYASSDKKRDEMVLNISVDDKNSAEKNNASKNTDKQNEEEEYEYEDNINEEIFDEEDNDEQNKSNPEKTLTEEIGVRKKNKPSRNKSNSGSFGLADVFPANANSSSAFMIYQIGTAVSSTILDQRINEAVNIAFGNKNEEEEKEKGEEKVNKKEKITLEKPLDYCENLIWLAIEINILIGYIINIYANAAHENSYNSSISDTFTAIENKNNSN